MDDQMDYSQAKRRVRRLNGFYIHLTVYVVVNAVLAAINFATTPNNIWFYWPLLGWGIGLLAHAAAVFAGRPAAKDAEERRIREMMEKGKPK